jgi:hypothetical protein
MLREMVQPEDDLRRSKANDLFFLVAAIVGLLYLFAYGPGLLSSPIGGINHALSIAFQIMILSPVAFVATLWWQRERLVPLDRHMLYLPLLLWYVTFVAVQSVPNHMKSMSNGYLESLCVLTISCLYLVRFPLSKVASAERSVHIAWGLFGIVSMCSVLVAMLFPSLPE